MAYSRKQSSFDGQNSNDLGEQDKLVSIAKNQTNPYLAKASDWPDGKSPADVGTGQGSGATWESPKSGGYDSLVMQNKNQMGPRHAETTESSAMNDSMDERKAAVAAGFKVSTNKGESESKPSAESIPESIDLLTGKISCAGYKASPVGEVGQRDVKLG
jgi:hypothetical protein